MSKNNRDLMKEKRISSFAMVWMFFAFFLAAVYFDYKVNKINATMMAFSYKYGFVSRGLIGSIFQFIDAIVPFDMLQYDGVMGFTTVITVIYFLILFAFFMICLYKCNLSISEEIKYIILFFTIWAMPMFVTNYNFGRLDIYCVMLSLLGAIMLICEKAEWLVVVFSGLSVMIHQGNVFMFLNIILILLLYKALSNEGKKRRKYLILLGASFGVASGLFIYFEFFSHMSGEDIYNEVVGLATLLCKNGKYHKDVIDHEILGVDLADRELKYRLMNLVQFPIFIVLMIPYIVLAVKLFRNIIRNAQNKLDKLKYFFVSIGACTIIPDLLLKCDYGRWMFAIICYYAVIILALIAMKDKLVETEVKNLMTNVEQKIPGAIILLVYPIVLQPLSDVSICSVTSDLANMLNDAFLHWW